MVCTFNCALINASIILACLPCCDKAWTVDSALYATICGGAAQEPCGHLLSSSGGGRVRFCVGVVVIIMDPGKEENLCKMLCFMNKFCLFQCYLMC